ncbi:allatostatin-A receptor-like, partial [Schistocerca nitens]|uniref:allatostatin-A receptor-like n=1 Tax=Schistocerca nitens TaxID=7011 RepID=UPI002118EA77
MCRAGVKEQRGACGGGGTCGCSPAYRRFDHEPRRRGEDGRLSLAVALRSGSARLLSMAAGALQPDNSLPPHEPRTTPLLLSHRPVTAPDALIPPTITAYAAMSLAVLSPCSFSPRIPISFFLTSYVLPLLLIVSLYLRMLMRLWRAGAPGGHLSAESRRGKKRVTRMVVVVVAIFAVCWCPIQVILVLKTVGMYDITTAKVMLQIVSHVLAYMNSCVNPILYAFLSDNFRKAFRKVIYCGPAGGGGGAQRGR